VSRTTATACAEVGNVAVAASAADLPVIARLGGTTRLRLGWVWRRLQRL